MSHFSDVTSLWKIPKDLIIKIATDVQKRKLSNEIQTEIFKVGEISIEKIELEHNHIYDINKGIFLFYSGFLIPLEKYSLQFCN
jgi:hypothetical protein